MDLTERLALIIDAHTAGAVTSMRTLGAETKATGDRVEVLQAKLTALEARQAKNATDARALQINKLRKEYDALNASLTNMPRGAATAEQALARLGLGNMITGKQLIGGATVAGAGLLSVGAFEFIKHGIQDYTALADAIRDVQRSAGGTAQDASRLVAVTQTLGIDSQTAALGLFRLGKNIEGGKAKLDEYGISVARTKDGNTDLYGTLLNVSDAYNRTTDPAKRAALVFQAFGKAGQSMLPILAAGRDRITELGNAAAQSGRILSQGDLDKARQFEITSRELTETFRGLEIQMTKGLVPAFEQLMNAMGGPLSFLARHGEAISSSLLGGFKELSIPGIGPLLFNHKGKSQKQRDAEAHQQYLDEQTKAQQDATTKALLATLAGPFDALAVPQNVAKAKADLADARDAVEKAKQERRQAQSDLANLGSGGASPREIEAASLRLQAAEERLASVRASGKGSLAGAQAAVLTAQDALNNLNAKGAVTTDQLANAQYRLRDANKAVADAQAKVKAAQAAQNQATGLSATDLFNRILGQARDQTRKAGANVRLAQLGLSADVIQQVDELDRTLPGTLTKVAKTMTSGLAAKLNEQEARLTAQQTVFAGAVLGADALYKAAGEHKAEVARKAFLDALGLGHQGDKTLPVYGPPQYPSGPSRQITLPTPRPGLAPGLLGPQINLNGPITVVAPDSKKFASDIEKQSRISALAGSGGAGGHLLGG